jgi:hypothetical protein
VKSKLSLGALALIAWMAMALSTAAEVTTEEAPLVTGTFSLRHREASEAIALVHPLLTVRGVLELRPVENTLVIRDVAEAVEQALALLAEFDAPLATLRFGVRIVSASVDGGGGRDGSSEALPRALLERLRELLGFDSFQLLSDTVLTAAENQSLEAWVGPEFQVRFRAGAVQVDRRIKLHDFQVARRQEGGDPEVMIHTNLSLWLDRPMVLGLARTESSERALMVVIDCTVEGSREATSSTTDDPS